MEDVFTNDYTFKDLEAVTISDYLQTVLDQIWSAIDQIDDRQKR